jgi:multidrug efflux pump subunit AcrA (membrane-fusion protein)
MIKFNAAPEFDFDEWATLHQRDPEAFEARRRALLAIELAKGGDKAGTARELLERLEGQLEGKSAAERARLSMLAMAESARLMTDRLAQLSEQVREHAALQSRLPRGAA